MTDYKPVNEDVQASILDICLKNKPKSIPQHIVVCGEFGYGKTVLLNRIFGKLDGAKLRKAPYSLIGSVDDIISPDEEKPTFLLIDDFDLLLHSLGQQGQYALRAALFTKGAPMMIGTCRRQPKAITDYREPFYDAFRLFFLKPDLEGRAFFSDKDYERLMAQPEWKNARDMMNGNMYYLSDFAKHFHAGNSIDYSIRAIIMSNQLYFRNIFLSLPNIQQRVLIGVAGVRDAASIVDIRQTGRIESTGITAALGKLQERQIIKQIGRQKRNYSYKLCDELFAEWIRLACHNAEEPMANPTIRKR